MTLVVILLRSCLVHLRVAISVLTDSVSSKSLSGGPGLTYGDSIEAIGMALSGGVYGAWPACACRRSVLSPSVECGGEGGLASLGRLIVGSAAHATVVQVT